MAVTTLGEQPEIPADLIAMLDFLAETIVEALGFGVAVVNLARSDGFLEVVSVAGDEDARSFLMGASDTAETWRLLLAASEDWGHLRFHDHNLDLAESLLLTWAPCIEAVDAEDAWHAQDALFAPLIAEDGALLGVLSVDLPTGGRRPNLATRHALEAFAVSAALAIEHATMRQRAELSERLVVRQATHDSLTGIANRSLLESRLRDAVGHKDSKTLTALVFIDIDRFKLINDMHSHATGDQVLRAVADRISGAIRPYDTVARWGGDEFLVLLERLPDEAAAVEVVQRISSSLADPVHAGDREVGVTVSMGVALRGPDDSFDADELIRRADTAMYEVKDTGRNCYALFNATRQSISRRLHLLDLLSRALSQERIVVHYQPLVQVSDQAIIGVEALLKLRDDDGSLVPQLDFLHLARESGTLIPIEREVIRQACSQVAGWVEDGHDLRVSVKVSAEQLGRTGDLEGTIYGTLADSRLAPSRLVCEVSEHSLGDLSETTIAGIQRLAQRGLRISIGDFGTGSGCFRVVQELPINELKIDRSYVASALAAGGAIIRSIAGLAADLGMSCVAEGVETPEQHEVVLRAGVPLAEGSLYTARPVDAEALENLLVGATSEHRRLASPTPHPPSRVDTPKLVGLGGVAGPLELVESP